MSKKLLNFSVLIIGIGLIISLLKDISYLLKAGNRVKQVQFRVEQLKQKQAELEKQKEYYQSEEFVEEQARNRLNYSKPGESVLILPPNVESLVHQQPAVEIPSVPNWKQWWQLFFKG